MKNHVIDYLNNQATYCTVDEIYRGLGLTSSKDFVALVKVINELEDEGIILINKNNRVGLSNLFDMVRGKIIVKEAGFGFFTIDHQFYEETNISFQLPKYKIDFDNDIYISFENRKTALDGDIVLVQLFKGNSTIEGRVVKILKRASASFIGIVKYYQKKYLVESLNKKLNISVTLKKDVNEDYKSLINQVVKVEIIQYFEKVSDLIHPIGIGHIVEVYDDYSKPGMDLTAILLANNYHLDFPSEVNTEIEQILPMVPKEKLENRVDLTKQLIVTIDGDDAKDLDDAISVLHLANGNYFLGVYIADVSEYVKVGSNTDEEAYNRGTSTYLPDRVIPMLPKALSNGICSLNEGVIRLVMACEMEIDLKGTVVNSKIFKGFIKSAARLTYQNVNAIFAGDKEIAVRYQTLVPMLKDAYELSKILYNMRIKRGAFEFETIESKIILDDNLKAIDIKIANRGDAEKLIEEFMLIANETVAETMKWLDVPFVYRVHDEPNEEKMVDFMEYAKLMGYKIKTNNKKAFAKSLQDMLIKNKASDYLRSKVMNKILLRSMAKAKYQSHNIGHFGLASKCYTHFTSPIRRYPDLMVHRLIKQFLLNEEIYPKNSLDHLAEIIYEEAEYASVRERVAESVERLAEDIKKTEYLSSKIGMKFQGTISSVTNYGCYVMLDNSVEGFVSFNNMPKGYYFLTYPSQGVIVDESKRISYMIGEKVLIKVHSTDKKLHRIDFELIKKIKR